MCRLMKWLLRSLGLVLLLFGATLALMLYLNWYAEGRARSFCEQISIGSDISAATARADDRKISWQAGDGHLVSADEYFFVFPGFVAMAGCIVSVDQGGKVRSKYSTKASD